MISPYVQLGHRDQRNKGTGRIAETFGLPYKVALVYTLDGFSAVKCSFELELFWTRFLGTERRLSFLSCLYPP